MLRLSRLVSNLVLFSVLAVACLQSPGPETKTPTNSPTQAPAITTRPTRPSPAATEKPTEIILPTAISTATSGSYHLPSWVSATQSKVYLRASLEEETYRLSFYNLATGERFSLPLIDFQGYFWTPDGKQVGLWRDRTQSLLLVDLISGKVNEYTNSEFNIRFLGTYFGTDSPASLVVSKSSRIENRDFTLIWTYSQHVLSYDERYSISKEYDPLTVQDTTTRQSFSITTSQDSLYDFDYSWSPHDYRIAVVRSSEEPAHGSRFGDQLMIYDIASQTLLASYSGEFGNGVQWSPDGTQILYDGGQTPCILHLSDGTDECLNLAGQISEDYTGFVQWSPDGQAISYLYSKLEDDLSIPKGGICIVSLATRKTTCPTDMLTDLRGRSVVAYTWSPDGQYLVFEHDISCPRCDYSTRPIGAFIAVDGSQYLSMGYSPDFGRYGLWRPSEAP